MHISPFSALIISNIPGHLIYSNPRMFDDSLSCARLPPCWDGYLSPSPLSSTTLGAEFHRKSPLELTVLAGLFEKFGTSQQLSILSIQDDFQNHWSCCSPKKR